MLPSDFGRRVRGLAIGLTAALLLLIAPRWTPADDAVVSTTSLQFVPDSAAFYSSMLNNKRQLDALLNSQAFAKLKALPAYQLVEGLVGMQWNNADNPQLAQFRQFWAAPENKELLDFLADATSSEVFFYGDGTYAELLVLMNDLNRQVRKLQSNPEIIGSPDAAEALSREFLKFMLAHADKIQVPDTVIGFRVTNSARATTQLARLEQLALMLGQANPLLQGRVKKESIGGGDYIAIRLDGRMVPWQQIPIPNGVERAQWDALVEKLSKKTVAVAIGLRGDYVLLSLGDTTEHLASLGKGKLLAGRTEFAPLRKAPAQPWTGIGYVSADFMRNAASPADQFEQIIDLLRQPAVPIPEDVRNELIKDAQSWLEDLKKLIPQQSAVMSYKYLTPRGYESYTYNFAVDSSIDGSRPLTILNHVGDNPLLFAASRTKSNPAALELLNKIAPRALYYFEKLAESQTAGKEREIIQKIRPTFEPLLKRFTQITRDQLQPALADGQIALVVDDKTTATQWHTELPPSAAPLGFPAPALVFGVSDAEKLKQACQGYFDLTQEFLDKLHALAPEDIPEIKIPAPQFREFPNGGIHYYTLPAEAGFHKSVAPNAGLTKSTAILSLLPQQTRRLIEPSTLSLDGPLAQRDKPLAGAAHFNFAGLVDTLQAWANYVQEIEPSAQQFVGQATDVWPILKCWRGISSASYVEGGVLVTRTESRYIDLQP